MFTTMDLVKNYVCLRNLEVYRPYLLIPKNGLVNNLDSQKQKAIDMLDNDPIYYCSVLSQLIGDANKIFTISECKEWIEIAWKGLKFNVIPEEDEEGTSMRLNLRMLELEQKRARAEEAKKSKGKGFMLTFEV